MVNVQRENNFDLLRIICAIAIVAIHVSGVYLEALGSNEILGENIKRIRLARGLTQEQTVARLQVLGSPLSRSTYSLIEMGRGNIFVNDLVGLRQVFNVSYEEFFKDIPPSRSSKQSPDK